MLGKDQVVGRGAGGTVYAVLVLDSYRSGKYLLLAIPCFLVIGQPPIYKVYLFVHGQYNRLLYGYLAVCISEIISYNFCLNSSILVFSVADRKIAGSVFLVIQEFLKSSSITFTSSPFSSTATGGLLASILLKTVIIRLFKASMSFSVSSTAAI